MDEEKLKLLKNILNTNTVQEIKYISKDTVCIFFVEDMRIFIDSNDSGVEFSLHAMTNEGAEIIDKLEE